MDSPNNTSLFIHKHLLRYFKKQVGNRKFCIISNDCWGAEPYKLLGRPFNSPFIGLMLMSPCYIKLLEDPKNYLKEPLNFKSESRYPEMQQIKSGINFPLAVLGDSDIEVHFMHYRSKDEAESKWIRRSNRMDWDNLYIKYDCGKDYATKEDVERFIKMNYANKLLFGKEKFEDSEYIMLKKYDMNARKQFKNCFLNFNPFAWLAGDPSFNNLFQKMIGRLAYKHL